MRPLFPHQEQAILRLRQSLGMGRRRPMLQAPTGFGKTLLSAAIVQGALRKDKRVVFCVPDHSDTHLRLGFVTDIHHEALDDGKSREKVAAREREEALPKECTSCSFLKPPRLAECPACGFKPTRQSEIECEDGELLELKPAKPKVDHETKQLWYSMLKHIGNQRGYAPGWVDRQYKDKFGVWPRGMNSLVREPTADVWRWVKSRQIAYAKRRTA